MSRLAAMTAAVAAVGAIAPFAYAATPKGDAEQALRSGRYEQARRLACATGRPRGGADTGSVLLCAKAELALGRNGDARQRLEAAAETRPDDLPLRDALMRLYDAVGDRAALAPLIDASYADWNAGKVARNRPADLLAVATAVRLDGNWKDANDALRDAVRANPRATAANLDWGDVLLEKHNADDAEAAFKDVLKVDPDNPDAHVGLAHVAVADRYDGAAALEELRRALAVNPTHAGALALRAALALDAENWTGAAADVAAIRRTNPRDLGAARVAAAAALLLDDRAGYERARAADLAARPNDGAFFAFVAETLTHHRRYDDARDVANEGVAADPDDPGCLATLAMTLLRLGDETAGLDALRRAWKRDPYDVRTYNLLNLYEKVIPARYTTVEGPRLRFRVPTADRAAITEVVAPYLQERYRELAARYRLEPTGPVILELYGDAHEFAVRTTGLPAIGVAGVCFGRVDHVAGAQQPRLQLGHGADPRAGARVRDPAIAIARPALVHRRALGAGDGASATRMDPPRRRRPLRGPAPGRAASPALAVERLRDSAGRRGGPRLRARGGGRRIPRTPVRLPGSARRADRVRARGVRGRRHEQDDRPVGGRAGA